MQGEKGDTGATGNGIASIQKTSTSGLVDTYTITYTNGTTTTFEVTNGEDGEVTENELNVVRTDVDDLRRNQLMNTETGSNINVDDAFDTRIMEDVMTKESTQTGTPTPENPVEVKTVKGYRNLFDKTGTHIDNYASATELTTGIRATCLNAYTNISTKYVVCDLTGYEGKTIKAYCHSKSSASNEGMIFLRITDQDGNSTSSFLPQVSSETLNGDISATIEIPSVLDNTYHYLVLCLYGTRGTTPSVGDYVDYTNLMLVVGEETLPYVPYGTNWIYNKIIGKNLFDGVFRQGGWNGSSNIRCISTNAVVVNDSNLQYTVSTNLDTAVYKWSVIVSDRKLPASSYNTILDIGWKTSSSAIVNIPSISNSAYMYISLAKLDGTSTIDVNVIKNFQYQIEKANSATPYEAYKESIITLPLNNNEIAGIGDYKDELIVDKNGKCWLNKKIGKVVLDGTENWIVQSSTSSRIVFTTSIDGIEAYTNSNSIPNLMSSHFIPVSENAAWVEGNISRTKSFNLSYIYLVVNNEYTLTTFKEWLSTHSTVVYYVLAEDNLIDLNYAADLRLFNGINNISNGDDMDMVIKYVQDISIIINEIRNGQAL